MASYFKIENPATSCVIIPTPAGKKVNSGSFTLLLGDEVDRYETPAFEVPGAGISIRLKIMRRMNTTTGGLGIQFLLTFPENDVIVITVNGRDVILTSGPGSYVYQVPSYNELTYNQVQSSTAFFFEFTDSPVVRVTNEYKKMLEQQEKNVKLVVGEKEIPFSKELLMAKSEVFRAMFEHDTMERQTGIVKITDFSFDVVKQMTDYVMFDYCTLWDTKHKELAAIADKYNIIGMKMLANQKKWILSRIF